MTDNVIPTLSIKEGDTRPTLEYRIDHIDNLQSADEIRLFLQHEQSGDLIVNDTAEIVAGTATYQFSEYQTVKRGRHLAEFVVYWSDGERTVPSDSFLAVDIHEPIDREIDPESWDEQNASVAVLSVDTLQAQSESRITAKDPVDIPEGASVGDLEIDDSGTAGSISYGGGDGLTIDGNGVSAPSPTADTHVARLGDLGDSGSGGVSNPLTAALDANNYVIENLKDPVAPQDAANKRYVDAEADADSHDLLTGGIVGRTDPITHFEGNIWHLEEGAPLPDEAKPGDTVIRYAP